MIYNIVIFDDDDIALMGTSGVDTLRFDGLSETEAKALCKMAQEQGYTVVAFLRSVED